MKVLLQCVATSAVCLSIAATVALARGGHHGGRGGGFTGLCTNAASLDLTLSNIDTLLKTSGVQKAALEELQRVAKENSENMSRVCMVGDGPMSFTAKLKAAEKRLDVALAGDRKLETAAEKFYASLNDKQKELVDDLVFWPGQ